MSPGPRPMHEPSLALLALLVLAGCGEPAVPGEGSSSGAGEDTGLSDEEWYALSIKERCFSDVGDSEEGFPSYDELGAVVPRHCMGTDHQDIEDIELLVFLGDSITAGSPPTPGDEVYRALLTERLSERWPGLEVRDCSEWGARTDDYLYGKGEIPACFPEGGATERTLVVMTMGGNDLFEIAQDVAGGMSNEAASAEIQQALDYQREALEWLTDSSRFPAGSSVIFANVYEFTDATGDLGSCELAETLGFAFEAPELREAYVWVSEAYMAMAVDTNTDMLFLLEQFCGHGFYAGDPENECYRGDDAETWFDPTCIHPNPTGHAQIADMFMAVVET